MLRSSLSNDEQELVKSAQANVALVADDIWAPNSSSSSADNPELFRRLNRRLWTRSCKIAENYGKLGSATRSQRRVRDVIPESRLATYGDFEYEDEAELIRAVLYSDIDDNDDNEDNEKPTNGSECNDDKEPWMLDEVEEYLARIADAGRRRKSTREQVTKRDDTLSDSHKSSNQTASVREDRDKTPPLTMREIDETTTTTTATSAPPRFSVTNVSEAQLEGRIFNDSIRNLWRSLSPLQPITTATITTSTAAQQHQLHRGLRSELQRELGLLRPQSMRAANNNDVQQTHSNFQTERLRMPSRSHYSFMQSMNVMHHHRHQQHQRPPALCVEVPEFFPNNNNNKNPSWPVVTMSEDCVKYIENPYQDDIYTYKAHAQTNNSGNSRKAVALYQNTLVPMVPTPIVSAIVWPSQTWAQRILPPPIPIHQMPTAAAPIAIPQPAPAPMCPAVVHRPIRLAEPTTNKHPTSSHKHIPVYQRTAKVSQEYPQRRKSQGVDFNNLILLTKSAMKVRKTQTKPARKSFAESARMSHVKSDASTTTTTTRWLDKGCQKREREFVTVTTSHRKNPNEDNNRATVSSSTSNDDNDEENDKLSIESFATPRKQLYDNEITNFEKSYDELERQAMEQYRTSEECLALRYQELEQQALEQYRTAGSTESINESGRVDLRNDEEEKKVDNVNDEDNNDDDGETRDRCSSGFGKCNSPDLADDEREKKAEDPEQQQPARIRILRAEVQRTVSEGSLRRPIAVARRLPQNRSQKNTNRGASDDNIVKASSSLSSLKRRLMPMSPLERTTSGGCSTMTTTMRNLDPVKAAVQTLDKHVAAYYRNNNVSQTGSGDAKVNGTAVWLSDFWS